MAAPMWQRQAIGGYGKAPVRRNSWALRAWKPPVREVNWPHQPLPPVIGSPLSPCRSSGRGTALAAHSAGNRDWKVGTEQSQESHTTAVVPGRRLCESSSIRSSAAANSSRFSDSGDSGV